MGCPQVYLRCRPGGAPPGKERDEDNRDMDFIDELKEKLRTTPQSEVATILECAYQEGDAEYFVSMAVGTAPHAMLGIGLEVGLLMARLDSDIAGKYLDKAQASRDKLQRQDNIELEGPMATERIAIALIRIVKEME